MSKISIQFHPSSLSCALKLNPHKALLLIALLVSYSGSITLSLATHTCRNAPGTCQDWIRPGSQRQDCLALLRGANAYPNF